MKSAMPNFKLKQQFYELTYTLWSYEGVKKHLDEAKTWYNRTCTQVEPIVGEAEQKRSLEDKLGDAGTALAKRERRIRQILSELCTQPLTFEKRKLPVNKSEAGKIIAGSVF